MSTPAQPAPLLEVRGVSKSFPGVRALADVSLQLARGEVLGVVGENGAGKSTLMKIIGGVYQPDAGALLLDGQAIRLPTVAEAQRLGIALIHQELNLASELDVAGNVFLGREPRWAWPLSLISSDIYRRTETVIGRLGLDCSPRRRVSELSIGQQQLVEIARALVQDARILIMDEPTSSLTGRETDRLFEVIRDLSQSGVSVLYISHRLPEIRRICHRVTVLRDGKNAGELSKDEITHDNLVRRMVGRELGQFFHSEARQPAAAAAPRLEVVGLQRTGKERPISFTVAGGQITALAGLMGAGRTELAEVLAGLRPFVRGKLKLDGRDYSPHSAAAAIAAGVCLVPEDRRVEGLLLADSVKRNLSLPSLKSLQCLGLVRSKQERALAENLVARLNVRTPGVEQTVGLLSGGNQQKVVFGKWLPRSPRLLILDEPTRGVDVGAKSEIYAIMHELAGQGMAVLMVSSDMEEALGVSDRVLVMHEGSLAGVLERADLSEEAVMHLATGQIEKGNEKPPTPAGDARR